MDPKVEQQVPEQIPVQSSQQAPVSQLPVVQKKSFFVLYVGIGLIVFLFLGTFALGALVLSQRSSTKITKVTSKASEAATQQSPLKNISGEVESKSWAKLESKYCSLSLHYPEDWEMSDAKFACAIEIKEPHNNQYQLTLRGMVLPGTTAQTATTVFATMRTMYPNSKDVTIAGEKGFSYTVNISNDKKGAQIIFPKGNVFFILAFVYPKADNEAEVFFEKIQSTIAFTGNPEDTIKPSKDLEKVADAYQQAFDTKRKGDIKSILTAVQIYVADHDGVMPRGITTAPREISKNDIDMCEELYPDYIASLPVDPSLNDGKAVTDCASSYQTGYLIMKDDDGKITITAPLANSGEAITVSK